MTAWLKHEPLSVDEVTAAVAHAGAGAVVLFLGVVREENEGRRVQRLDYTAYEPMALAEMHRVIEGIARELPGVRLAVAHRVGELAVGDLAVLCAASSKHRPDAFTASRALIDRIKADVPIWKREHGEDGPVWVGWVDARCSPEGHGSHSSHSHSHSRSHSSHSHSHSSHSHATVEAARAARPETPDAKRAIRVVTVTVSDTRTSENDTSGRALVEELAEFTCVRRELVRDDPEAVREVLRRAAEDADAVVLTGGTGIAPRDTTFEAVTAMFDRTLDGFGETFRRLSWDEVGPRAMLSRATAGVVGSMLVFALPGSTNAARLGARALVAPLLVHAVALLRSPPDKESR